MDRLLHNSEHDPRSMCAMCSSLFHCASHTAFLNESQYYAVTYLHYCNGKNDFKYKNFKEMLLNDGI